MQDRFQGLRSKFFSWAKFTLPVIHASTLSFLATLRFAFQVIAAALPLFFLLTFAVVYRIILSTRAAPIAALLVLSFIGVAIAYTLFKIQLILPAFLHNLLNPATWARFSMSCESFFVRMASRFGFAHKIADIWFTALSSALGDFEDCFGESETAKAIAVFSKQVAADREEFGLNKIGRVDWSRATVAYIALQRMTRDVWLEGLKPYLSPFPSTPSGNTLDLSTNPNSVALLKRFAKYAEAAYGHHMVSLMSGQLSHWLKHIGASSSEPISLSSTPSPVADAASKKADDHPYEQYHTFFAQHIGASVDVIKCSSFSLSAVSSLPAQATPDSLSKAYRPTFFVIVDHSVSAIVLALRGTLDVHDLMIDLTCDYADLLLQSEAPTASSRTEQASQADSKSDPSTFSLPSDSLAASAVLGAQSSATSQSFSSAAAYQVHAGMLKVARRCADLSDPLGVAKAVADALSEHPSYNLVVTGHSLGAGVGSLLTALWTDSSTGRTSVSSGLPVGRLVHCYAFAAPAVGSAAFGSKCSSVITSIVNGFDMVPRVSLGSARDLLRARVYLHKRPEVRKRIRQISFRQLSKPSEPIPESDLAYLNEQRASLQSECLTGEKHYPAGTVIWITKHPSLRKHFADIGGIETPNTPARPSTMSTQGTAKDGADRQKESQTTTIVQSFLVLDVSKCLGDIVYSRSMLSDHFPRVYDRVVSLVAE